MHCNAFTPIEGFWLSQNLPCSEAVARRSASADEMQFGGHATLFEHRDPLFVTCDQSMMGCSNLRVQRQILGRLLFGPPPAIIIEVLVHVATPVTSAPRGPCDSLARLIHIAVDAALTV